MFNIHYFLLPLVFLFLENASGQTLTSVLSQRLPGSIYGPSSIYDGDDSIYVLGGWTKRDILKYTISTELVTTEAELPSPLYEGGVAFDEKKENIYYLGGTTDGASAKGEIYKFNVASKSVTLAGQLKTPANWASTITYKSKVFLFGGGAPQRNLIQCWDMATDTTCPDKIPNKYFLLRPAVSIGNQGYIFGEHTSTAKDSVYKVNLDTFLITVSSPILPKITTSAAVVSGTNAYIIGGWAAAADIPGSSIIQVDLTAMKTTVLPVEGDFIPAGRYLTRSSAVFVEKLNRIYVIGGYSDGNGYEYHDEIWYIDLTPVSGPITTEPTTTTTEVTTTTSTQSPPSSTTTQSPSPFDCSSKPDGFYAHPSDCAQFVRCSNRVPFYYTCPAPLLFNPKINACDYPDQVECGVSCVGKPNGMYPHPQDCSLFIACRNSVAEVYKCPAPLLFDPTDKMCNVPEEVDCQVK